MAKIPGFKAYDIRAKVPDELDEALAYKIGRALVTYLDAKSIVVGRDVRESSPRMAKKLSEGITDSGADVIDIGLCGTEMVYYAASHLDTDGGAMITASHNPPEYNGMKFVRKGSAPIGYDSGLADIEELILKEDFGPLAEKKGAVTERDISDEFLANLRKFYDPKKMKPYRVVVNPGNGCAGPILDKMEAELPIEMIKMFHEPDPTFPNGVPNPMIEENRVPTAEAIRKHGADLGVAWDGDYDRCFFFDENGEFVEGYYVVGLLAKSILKQYPGEKIVHDPRLVWNTVEIVREAGGEPVESKSGHAFMKHKMREIGSIYGGEMSAHHYFRDNAYSDSGLLPFMLALQLMTEENKKFSELVGEMIAKYPCSGEINSRIADPKAKIAEIKAKYADGTIEEIDGVSVEYDDWRFNLRESNTEPILRLNVEAKGDEKLMKAKTEELLAIIRG